MSPPCILDCTCRGKTQIRHTASKQVLGAPHRPGSEPNGRQWLMGFRQCRHLHNYQHHAEAVEVYLRDICFKISIPASFLYLAHVYQNSRAPAETAPPPSLVLTRTPRKDSQLSETPKT